MKMYRVLNKDSVKDCAGDFIGMIFKGEETNRGKFNQVKLSTFDGNLYFELDEVEEVAEESNHMKLYNKCVYITEELATKEMRLAKLRSYIDGVNDFINIDSLNGLKRQFELIIKNNIKTY